MTGIDQRRKTWAPIFLIVALSGILAALPLAGCYQGSPPAEEHGHHEHGEDHSHSDDAESDHEHAENHEGHSDEHSEGDEDAHSHSDEVTDEENWEHHVGEAEEEEHVHHDHEAPHGGTLVALGDHFAHLEIMVDAESGEMTAYVLDAEAEEAVRLEQESIEIRISLPPESAGSGAKSSGQALIVLNPVANPLTGETVGDTSEFRGQSDDLKGKDSFGAVVQSISILGEELSQIAFQYPEGNE